MVLTKKEQESLDQLFVMADVAAVRLVADGREKMGKDLMGAVSNVKGYMTYGEVYSSCGKQE